MYQALVSYFELFDNFVTIRILLLFSLTVLKFPGVAGMGAGGRLKGSLGRGLLPKGLQTFILFTVNKKPFSSLPCLR